MSSFKAYFTVLDIAALSMVSLKEDCKYYKWTIRKENVSYYIVLLKNILSPRPREICDTSLNCFVVFTHVTAKENLLFNLME